MNWDDLRFFLAAVRQQTFSAAARELKVNRTTVARRIAQLEKTVGQALFVHQHNQYQLSEFGEELYRQAVALEATVQSLQDSLGLEEQRLEGDLRIAAPLGLGPEFLPELAEFSRQYPSIRWELANTLDPIAALNQRRADVAIAVSNSCPHHITGHHVGELTRALYASKRYLRRFPADATLTDHQWIGWGEDLAQSQAARWMARELPDNIYKPAEVNSWHALREAVACGLGVAHLWCFLADADRRLKAIRQPTAELTMGLWLMHLQSIPANARVKAFVRTLSPLLKARITG